MSRDIYLILSGLKLVSKVNGKPISIRLDICVIELFFLLLPNTIAWYYSRVTHFYNILSVELQEATILDGYTLSNNSTLSTLFAQTLAL